jgi:lipid-A-disaccharide synthase
VKYYIISGEASGDLHGSNLMKAILKNDSEAEFRFWGGDKMQAVGGFMVTHYKHMAFMGFWEVIKNLVYILQKMKLCKADILQWQPDAVILIDYPGFNLKIAEFTHLHKFKTYFYISPQVWAWKSGRVKQIKQFIDKMFVILPFEKAFYEKWNYDVEYVGHPLMEVINIDSKTNTLKSKNEKVVALLPGSRMQEILVKLPIMAAVAEKFPDINFIVAKASSANKEWYDEATKNIKSKNISFVENKTYELLQTADAALVTSGTATLETALWQVPQVVCYKGSWLSYQIGKQLVKIKYISLVNLIMDKLVVKELIQNDLTVENLVKECNKLLNDTAYRTAMIEDYKKLNSMLAESKASAKTANWIIEDLKNTKK